MSQPTTRQRYHWRRSGGITGRIWVIHRLDGLMPTDSIHSSIFKRFSNFFCRRPFAVSASSVNSAISFGNSTVQSLWLRWHPCQSSINSSYSSGVAIFAFWDQSAEIQASNWDFTNVRFFPNSSTSWLCSLASCLTSAPFSAIFFVTDFDSLTSQMLPNLPNIDHELLLSTFKMTCCKVNDFSILRTVMPSSRLIALGGRA